MKSKELVELQKNQADKILDTIKGFDEIKKELDHKVEYSNKVNELHQHTTHELTAVQNQLESVYNELNATRAELQMYKNDFILKSATF